MVDFNPFLGFILVVFFLWLPQAVHQILTWTYWWQVKEYRSDRFWDFLKTSDGRRKLGLYGIFLKLLGIMLLNSYYSLPLIIFLYFNFIFLKTILEKRVRKPVVTERIEKIWITCFFGILLTFFSMYFFFFNALIIGEILLILTPILGIFWTVPIVNKVKQQEIEKAKDTLNKIRPTVIGITGSYGKTTTKEFIAHLLSQKYKTAKTEGSENTEFGIARKTFKNVKQDTQFFVVEMGAYKKGEIKKLAAIVTPSTGIITGLEPQHLSLFGSFDNIKEAKYELIESLPEGGIAIFNVTNSHVEKLFQKAKKLRNDLKVYGYLVVGEKEIGNKADLRAKVVSADIKGITFDVTDGKERRRFEAKIAGVHFIENLTGAILVARLFGLSWREIEKGVSTLVASEHTMKVYNWKNGNVIVDDSYNSTPQGFEAAMSYLNLFQGKKKLVISAGIIELGVLSNRVHEHLGKTMDKMVDKVILLNDEPYKVIRNVTDKVSVNLIEDPEKVFQEVKKVKESVILLEGRQPSKLINYIEGNKND